MRVRFPFGSFVFSLSVPSILKRLSCAVALGCALASTAHVSASSSERADNSGDQDEFVSSIRFAPCAEDATLECGTLAVPVDYRKPHGKTVGLAVIRAKATSPAKRIGILVGNPGGPGISGVDFLLGVSRVPVVQRLRERFDILSFDPRGVSRSRAVGCVVEPTPLPPTSDDAALAAAFDDYSRRFAQACLEQNGSFITHIGTMNAARDIDTLRRALGEKQISYAAGSYGTVLGAAYASLFPERVRAMMLDGAEAPEFRDSLVESWSEMSGAFETAFRRLDQVCRRDPGCRLAAAGVVDSYDEVAARLEAMPLPSPGGAVLTRDALAGIVATLIDAEANWPLIVDALADARSGDYGLLFQLLPFIEGDVSALAPIRCNDYGTRRSAADYLRIDEAIGALFPRFFGRFFVASLTAPCAAFPDGEPVVVRNVRNQVATPFMIIGNDFDSRTPLRAARSLAHALGMERHVVRYAGSGHTALFSTTACIQDTVEDYLVNLRVPAEGFTCPGQPIVFAPSLQRRSTVTAATVVRVPGFRIGLPKILR